MSIQTFIQHTANPDRIFASKSNLSVEQASALAVLEALQDETAG